MKIPHYTGLYAHKVTIDIMVYRENERQVYIKPRIRNREGSIRKVYEGRVGGSW
jgi:hypothetical protein